MKKHIPNFFTSLNLFSGCIASVMAFNGEYLLVVILVLLSAVFDFFDGFFARILKAYSLIGKDLDSLADMVSFGLVPSLLVFRYLSDNTSDFTSYAIINELLPYTSFLLTIYSALRLAKFNNDERQATTFIGLPTPANAIFWISFCYGLATGIIVFSNLLFYSIIILIIVFSYLMISEIPMFSLKIKNLKIEGNKLRYILAIFILVTVIIWGIFGLAISILFYIAISVLSYKKISS